MQVRRESHIDIQSHQSLQQMINRIDLDRLDGLRGNVVTGRLIEQLKSIDRQSVSIEGCTLNPLVPARFNRYNNIGAGQSEKLLVILIRHAGSPCINNPRTISWEEKRKFMRIVDRPNDGRHIFAVFFHSRHKNLDGAFFTEVKQLHGILPFPLLALIVALKEPVKPIPLRLLVNNKPE